MNLSMRRCLAVWTAVTGSAAGAAWWALTGLRLDGSFDQLVAAVAGLALAGCATWAWAVTTVVVGQAVRGVVRPVRGVPVWAGRVVLAACGLAVLTAVPAHATSPVEAGRDPGTPRVRLDGLPLPDRATGPARATSPTRVGEPGLAGSGRTHVVAPGESLWTIAADRLPPRAAEARIAAETTALYDLNRRRVGDDPDLIHPGQRLRVPEEHPDR